MQQSFRRYLVGCVNLFGAGVISMTPLAPSVAAPAEPSAIQVTAVQPAALPVNSVSADGFHERAGYLSRGPVDRGDGLTSRLAGAGKVLAMVTAAISGLGGLRRHRRRQRRAGPG